MPNIPTLAVIVAVGVALVALFLTGPRVFRGSLTLRRALRCPFQGRDVVVDFEETAWDGRLVDVLQCTAFTPPVAVGCEKACLRLARFRRVEGR